MWKTLIFQENYYLFQVKTSELEITINLSDLQNIWSCKTSEINLIKLFKEFNPLLDQDAKELYNSCLLLMKQEFIDNLTLDDNTQECNVKFKHFLEDFPLKLEIALKKCTDPEFFKQITIPIIQTVQYLEFKQKKLETLLAQKDKEILQYVHEYGNISIKMFETKKYEADTEMKPNLLINVFSSDESFNNTFAARHGDVQQLFPEVKMEKKPEKRKLQLAPSKNKLQMRTNT